MIKYKSMIANKPYIIGNDLQRFFYLYCHLHLIHSRIATENVILPKNVILVTFSGATEHNRER